MEKHIRPLRYKPAPKLRYKHTNPAELQYGNAAYLRKLKRGEPLEQLIEDYEKTSRNDSGAYFEDPVGYLTRVRSEPLALDEFEMRISGSSQLNVRIPFDDNAYILNGKMPEVTKRYSVLFAQKFSSHLKEFKLLFSDNKMVYVMHDSPQSVQWAMYYNHLNQIRDVMGRAKYALFKKVPPFAPLAALVCGHDVIVLGLQIAICPMNSYEESYITRY